MRKIIFLLALLYSCGLAAQNKAGGDLQLGLRQTFSLFGDAGETGMGTGGQFRLMLGRRINTEWFADLIHTDLSGLGKRVDGHIGWSVMFYPLDPYGRNPRAAEAAASPRKILPYLLAGHCFDYTKVTVYSTLVADHSGSAVKRWSSAVQMGLGTHFFMGDRFNLSASCQYMLHLGNDIHTEVHTENGTDMLHVEQESTNNQLTFEGHLLFTLSLNIKIADLW